MFVVQVELEIDLENKVGLCVSFDGMYVFNLVFLQVFFMNYLYIFKYFSRKFKSYD